MNCENKNELEIKDTMTDTNPTFLKKECDDIGNQWTKICPKCGKMQSYSCKYTLRMSIEKNTICNQCRGDEKKIVVPFDGWTKNCPTCGKLQTYVNKSVLFHSIKRNAVCNQCQNETQKIYPLSGKWVRVGGYSLDGYDKEKNIVFEYDEPKHTIQYHKNKDKLREVRIINKLNPNEFWRYDEKNNKMYEILDGKEIQCQLQ